MSTPRGTMNYNYNQLRSKLSKHSSPGSSHLKHDKPLLLSPTALDMGCYSGGNDNVVAVDGHDGNGVNLSTMVRSNVKFQEQRREKKAKLCDYYSEMCSSLDNGNGGHFHIPYSHHGLLTRYGTQPTTSTAVTLTDSIRETSADRVSVMNPGRRLLKDRSECVSVTTTAYGTPLGSSKLGNVFSNGLATPSSTTHASHGRNTSFRGHSHTKSFSTADSALFVELRSPKVAGYKKDALNLLANRINSKIRDYLSCFIQTASTMEKKSRKITTAFDVGEDKENLTNIRKLTRTKDGRPDYRFSFGKVANGDVDERRAGHRQVLGESHHMSQGNLQNSQDPWAEFDAITKKNRKARRFTFAQSSPKKLPERPKLRRGVVKEDRDTYFGQIFDRQSSDSLLTKIQKFRDRRESREVPKLGFTAGSTLPDWDEQEEEEEIIDDHYMVTEGTRDILPSSTGVHQLVERMRGKNDRNSMNYQKRLARIEQVSRWDMAEQAEDDDENHQPLMSERGHYRNRKLLQLRRLDSSERNEQDNTQGELYEVQVMPNTCKSSGAYGSRQNEILGMKKGKTTSFQFEDRVMSTHTLAQRQARKSRNENRRLGDPIVDQNNEILSPIRPILKDTNRASPNISFKEKMVRFTITLTTIRNRNLHRNFEKLKFASLLSENSSSSSSDDRHHPDRIEEYPDENLGNTQSTTSPGSNHHPGSMTSDFSMEKVGSGSKDKSQQWMATETQELHKILVKLNNHDSTILSSPRILTQQIKTSVHLSSKLLKVMSIFKSEVHYKMQVSFKHWSTKIKREEFKRLRGITLLHKIEFVKNSLQRNYFKRWSKLVGRAYLATIGTETSYMMTDTTNSTSPSRKDLKLRASVLFKALERAGRRRQGSAMKELEFNLVHPEPQNFHQGEEEDDHVTEKLIRGSRRLNQVLKIKKLIALNEFRINLYKSQC